MSKEEYPYLVLNGDGIQVGEYETLAHANEAAKDMAQAALRGGDETNFYSVTDRQGQEVPGGKTFMARTA